MNWPIIKQDVINGKIIVTHFDLHKDQFGQDNYYKSQIFYDGGDALKSDVCMSSNTLQGREWNHSNLCMLVKLGRTS